MQTKDYCYPSEFSNNASIRHRIGEYIIYPLLLFPSQYVEKEKDIRRRGEGGGLGGEGGRFWGGGRANSLTFVITVNFGDI